MIKEIIVVEGRDDTAAIKRAIEAETIETHGLGITEETLKRIEKASKKRGIIVFTDPDYPGEKIRGIVSGRVKNCKHAFLPKDKALKDGDVGIENASPKDIIEALEMARVQTIDIREEFKKEDLLEYGLIGLHDSNKKRELLGRVLGIGHCNSKQFLKRLNNYEVTKQEFKDAISEVLIENE